MRVRVVIDVEMCKIQIKNEAYPYKMEIIQIGAVMMNEAYEIQDQFSTYVKPRFGRIDNFISTLTGISERVIKTAPDIESALEQLLDWIGDNEATFYAWSDTDYYQIRNEIQCKCRDNPRWEILLEQANWVDYQKLFTERLGSSRSFKLTEALLLTEVDTEGKTHDGLADAYNTAQMISKLERHTDYQTLIERIRDKEKKQKPLTMSLGDILQGLILEMA